MCKKTFSYDEKVYFLTASVYVYRSTTKYLCEMR